MKSNASRRGRYHHQRWGLAAVDVGCQKGAAFTLRCQDRFLMSPEANRQTYVSCYIMQHLSWSKQTCQLLQYATLSLKQTNICQLLHYATSSLQQNTLFLSYYIIQHLVLLHHLRQCIQIVNVHSLHELLTVTWLVLFCRSGCLDTLRFHC